MARLAPQRPTPPRTSYATSRMRAVPSPGVAEPQVMRDGRRGHRPLLVEGFPAIILARRVAPTARSRAVDAPGGLCYGTSRVTTRSRVCPERGQEGRRCETAATPSL